MLMRCATLCNRAEFLRGEDDVPIQNKKVRGDASEEAILKFVEMSLPQNMPPKQFRDKNPKLIEIPFSSDTKYQVRINLRVETQFHNDKRSFVGYTTNLFVRR